MPTTMPYNTRRKSLSLSELGITVPKRARGVSHPSPPADVTNDRDEPPVKKTKRSVDHSSASSGLMSPPRTTVVRIKDERPRAAPHALSPPPSPTTEENGNKVDVEGINDEIVVGTIQQLERTGNRPHLVKELGAVLATNLHCVEKSANPSALISSRLTAYLNRPWPAITRCPLAKDLSPVHPRRLYFYLTTMPRQPIPDTIEQTPKAPRIISPSLSSASAADEDEGYTRQRTALSPSPEVDLSSPELDDENEQPAPGRPFSGRNSLTRETSHSRNISHSQRAASPQLETEERDFKQTASALYELAQQQQKQNRQQDQDQGAQPSGKHQRDGSRSTDVIMHDGSVSVPVTAAGSGRVHVAGEGEDGSNDAVALFGHADHLKVGSTAHPMDFSSPVIRPEEHTNTGLLSKLKNGDRDQMLESNVDGHVAQDLALPDAALYWDNLQSPENIDMDELETMFDAY